MGRFLATLFAFLGIALVLLFFSYPKELQTWLEKRSKNRISQAIAQCRIDYPNANLDDCMVAKGFTIKEQKD